MGGGGEVESDLENCASEKNSGYAPGFVDYHEINEELLFWSSEWQDPLRQDPFLEKSESVVNKNRFWPDYAPCTNPFFDSLGSTAIVSE